MENWFKLWKRDHKQAFTVASKVKADSLREVRYLLDLLMAKGASLNEAKEAFGRLNLR